MATFSDPFDYADFDDMTDAGWVPSGGVDFDATFPGGQLQFEAESENTSIILTKTIPGPWTDGTIQAVGLAAPGGGVMSPADAGLPMQAGFALTICNSDQSNYAQFFYGLSVAVGGAESWLYQTQAIQAGSPVDYFLSDPYPSGTETNIAMVRTGGSLVWTDLVEGAIQTISDPFSGVTDMDQLQMQFHFLNIDPMFDPYIYVESILADYYVAPGGGSRPYYTPGITGAYKGQTQAFKPR